MKTNENRLEDFAEMGDRVRKEAEDFLNRWINDDTKGWQVRPALVGRYSKRFSVPAAISSN